MTKNNIKSNSKKKVILIILDGFGIGLQDQNNAIYAAKPQTFNLLVDKFPFTKIDASEKHVGLPINQPGNSEVGHITIGAGKIVYTGLGLINQAIDKKEFNKNNEILKAIDYIKNKNTNVQLFGLASNGDVHASLKHLYSLIDLCNENNVIPIINLFCDGRDTDKEQFIHDFKEINEKYLSTNKAKLGIVAGRYYAMDRNQNWDRTKLTFDELFKVGDNSDPIDYIQNSYKDGITDEFIIPKSFNTEQTILKENDALIFFNFRSDRIRQLVHFFTRNPNDYEYKPETSINNYVLGFMDYKMKGLENIAFIQPENNVYLGKIISDNNLKQLRIAETEKYAHVTYFLDSMHKDQMKGMDCVLIPSPSVATYDLKPEMSAKEITDYILQNYNKYDLIVVNYANSDMVGHTGNLNAAIKAIEALDEQLKRICDTIGNNDEFDIIITADHGNSDEMIDKNGKIVTSHTTNQVPFIILNKNYKLANGGSLANITPTILELMDIEIPSGMEKPLIVK